MYLNADYIYPSCGAQAEWQAVRAGNRRRAADMLGIGERTLYRKLKQYGL